MKRREHAEPNWPAEFVEFDPEMWESKYDWEVARVRWARARGYKKYKILPLLQQMTRTTPLGVEPSNQDGA